MMEFALKLQEVTGKDYLTYTSVKHAISDIRLFELYVQGRLNRTSDALNFGSAYDCLLFEPQFFPDRFIIFDDSEKLKEIGGASPKATKAYKEWKEGILHDTTKQILTAEENEKAMAMIKRLQDTGIIEKYLTGKYQVEMAGFIGEIPVRGFLDCKGDGYTTDLKSTRAVSGFHRDVFSFGYDVQAFIYSSLTGDQDYYWVAQDTSFPYTPIVRKASERTLEGGKMKFLRAVRSIEEYLFTNKPTDSYYSFGEI